MTEDITRPSHLSAALAGLVAKAAPSIVSVRSHRSQSSGLNLNGLPFAESEAGF